MRRFRLLHLGAGIQSSVIYSMMVDGDIEPCDYAMFADTQDEPSWVYDQLNWLESLGGPPIVRVTAGRLGDDLINNGRNSTGQRFASIPAHTTYKEGTKGGKTRRQCTREYKIEPIERWIRRDLLEIEPHYRKDGVAVYRMPKDVVIESLFGFSTDEPTRAVKMRAVYNARNHNWECGFPLFDEWILMTKADCKLYIEKKSGFEWRSSRCVYCPLQRNHHFLEIKLHDIGGFKRGIEVDVGLRTTGAVANRDMLQQMYVHRSCIPLEQAKLDEDQGTLFDDGGCDNGCFL